MSVSVSAREGPRLKLFVDRPLRPKRRFEIERYSLFAPLDDKVVNEVVPGAEGTQAGGGRAGGQRSMTAF